jgi:TOBE domain
MRGWVILVATFLVGAVVGFGAASRGPGLIAPYLPKTGGGSGEHIEGQVVRKQRDGNRLLVKITTAQGPMLVTFTQKVADLDVLIDPGDTVTLMIPGYATFVEDPVFERIKAAGPAKGPA